MCLLSYLVFAAVVILAGRPLHFKELAIHIAINLKRPCAVLQGERRPQPGMCCIYPLAAR